MLLKTFVVGPLDTNCYLLVSETSRDAMVVDAGAGGERLAREIDRLGLCVGLIVATHSHYDHVGGVASLLNAVAGQTALGTSSRDVSGREGSASPGRGTPLSTPFALHAADIPSLGRGEALREVFPGHRDPPSPERVLRGGEILTIGGLEIHILHTPGHTPGSICVYVPFPGEGLLFTGDTLFQMSIGRTDFPGGDQAKELASIRDILLSLPDATRVFPGHGPPTTIGDERRWNPFLRG